MKKNSIKIIALLAVATIGIFALYKSKKSEPLIETKDSKNNDLEDLLSKATSKEPFRFSKKTETSGFTMDYVYNGKLYTKKLMGANVRSTPIEITKEEFVEAYNAYLL